MGAVIILALLMAGAVTALIIWLTRRSSNGSPCPSPFLSAIETPPPDVPSSASPCPTPSLTPSVASSPCPTPSLTPSVALLPCPTPSLTPSVSSSPAPLIASPCPTPVTTSVAPLPTGYVMESPIPNPFYAQPNTVLAKSSLEKCIQSSECSTPSLCSAVLFDPSQNACWLQPNNTNNLSPISPSGTATGSQSTYSTRSQYAVLTDLSVSNPGYTATSYPPGQQYLYCKAYYQDSPGQCATLCTTGSKSCGTCAGFAYDPTRSDGCFLQNSAQSGSAQILSDQTLYYTTTSSSAPCPTPSLTPA